MKINEIIRREISNILLEEQKFDFDSNKKEILKFINKIMNGEKVNSFDSPFYNVIVGTPKVGDSSKYGLDDNFKKTWKDYLSTQYFDTDGVWSQRNFNKNIPRKTGNNRTLNYYITIKKDRENIIKFLNNLSKLDKELSNLSETNKEPISYKTHRLLDAFVSHNDSLKVYYYNESLKSDIVSIVDKWLNDNNIIKSDRTHEHGVDLKDGGGSFGQILANKIDDSLINTINTYKNKYTDQQYYEWIKKYLPEIIKKVKVK